MRHLRTCAQNQTKLWLRLGKVNPLDKRSGRVCGDDLLKFPLRWELRAEVEGNFHLSVLLHFCCTVTFALLRWINVLLIQNPFTHQG